MFNTEGQPTVQRIGRRLYYPHTQTPIVEESALESVLESADFSSKLADSNANSPKIGLWVWAFRRLCVDITVYGAPPFYFLGWINSPCTVAPGHHAARMKYSYKVLLDLR